MAGRSLRILSYRGLLVLLACLCEVVTAQTSHRVWNTETGLPQDTVHALLQARDGFLWMATEKDLVQFDGYKFVAFSFEKVPGIDEGGIRSLSEGSDGTIFLTAANMSLAFKEGRFLQVQQHPELQSVTKLKSKDGSSWTYSADEVTKRSADGIGRRWKVTGEGVTNRIQSILVDSQGIAWLGTRHGLLRVEGDRLAPVEVLKGDSILCLLEDREGDIWAGSSTTGLHAFSPQSIEAVPAFAGHGIATVTETKSGDLWVGTTDEGLLGMHQGKLRTLTSGQGLNSNFVLSLAASGTDEIFAGSPDGLNRVSNGRVISSLRSTDGLPDDFIRSILADSDDSFWIGTRRGLAHWSNKGVDVLDRKNGLASDLVGALLRSSNGDLWIGTLHGVSRLRDGQLTNFSPDEPVTSLVEDGKHRLWLGGASSGLYLMDGKTFHHVNAESMPQNIFGLLDDGHGSLWMRTHSGIGRLSLDLAESCAREQRCDLAVRVFNASDGLPSNDIYEQGHPGQIRGRNGELYFATRRGLVRIDPATVQVNRAVPLPSIIQVTVDNRERPVDAMGKIVLDPGDRRISFDYVAPSFRQPGEIRYRYRLEGFDKEWIDAGTTRSVSYTNLPPGLHRFGVMAENEDGVWSTQPAEITVSVQPPVYRRWWFYLLTALTAGAIFMMFYWLRERRLRQQFAAVLSERNRIAREIHDTLAQDLAGVSVQLEVISSLMKGQQLEAATLQLEGVKETVREGLTNARQSIWDLRATAEEQALPARAKRAVEQLSNSSQPIVFEVAGAYRAFHERTEDEILRVMQEAIRNALRHSLSDRIEVLMHYGAEEFVLQVRDDGQGFDLNQTVSEGHYGLQGMRERAEAAGVELTIESTRGKGTCVTLVSVYR